MEVNDYHKNENRITLLIFQAFQIFLPPWNIKGDVLENVHADFSYNKKCIQDQQAS